MNDDERLDEIKRRLESGGYLANSAADIAYLVELAGKLTKKNDVLAQHNMELTQEMENIKSDFGGNR